MRAYVTVCVCLVACSGRPPEPMAVAPAPTPSASTSATPDARTEPPAEPEDPFAGTLAEVAAARGLAVKGKVLGRRVNRKEMLDEVDREIAHEVPRKALEGTQEILIALDLAPPDFDYGAAIRRVMTAKLAGFYQPRTKTMFLAQDLPVMEQIITLNHELVHALQDQHFDLGGKLDYRDDAGDEQAALHALAEGDATSLMLDLMVRPQGKTALDIPGDILAGSEELPPEAGKVPGIIVRSIVAPYRDGLTFVHHQRGRAGWRGVDAVWKRPPVSTEQIIHPEKYASDERPLDVEIPAAPGEGWEIDYHDVMGEQSVRVLLEEWLDHGRSAAAASGWGGDRIAVYSRGERRAVAWGLRWDDEAGAKRLEGALRSAFGANAGRCGKGQRGAIAVHRAGSSLALVVAPYGSGAQSRQDCATALSWSARIAKGQAQGGLTPGQ
ncbi:MAG: DUF6782 family putative metallopeptidase [Polyangiaceae bacterium]